MNAKPFLPLLALLLAGAAGCAPDKMTLEVAAICAMTDGCSFAGTCGAQHIGLIEYNPGGPYPLTLALEVRNQVANNKDVKTGRVNTNDAHITGYKLEYGGNGPSGYTRYVGNQAVPAGGSAVIMVDPIQPGAPIGYYTVDVSLFGYYDNGREFEADPFPIFVQVAGYSFGCPTPGDVDTCPGTGQQNVLFCGAP